MKQRTTIHNKVRYCLRVKEKFPFSFKNLVLEELINIIHVSMVKFKKYCGKNENQIFTVYLILNISPKTDVLDVNIYLHICSSQMASSIGYQTHKSLQYPLLDTFKIIMRID